MHNLFIRIAFWIIKRLWLGYCKITLNDLTKIQKLMNNIYPPSEIGQIPHKINIEEANEQKNFF